MPDLAESLQGRDLGHLRIIAELWGIELEEQEIHSVLIHLTQMLRNPAEIDKMILSFSPEIKEALDDLTRRSGKVPWAQFTRKYGEVREMGIARRDREQPYKQPISIAEALWYLGLVARAFFDTPTGPEEFAYIPDDFLGLLPKSVMVDLPPMGRQASSLEYAQVFIAYDRILDHACTLLAALRSGIRLENPFSTRCGEELTPIVLKSLLLSCGLIDEGGSVLSEPARLFLEAERGQALAQLFAAWKQSRRINELRLLPGLSLEGNWENDPLLARQTVLYYIMGIPSTTWWSVPAFIAAIKQHNPDFQRPAGDYDSWFIREAKSGEYMRGFEQWDDVDGRLIRYILTGPLHWLGVLDLASPEPGLEAAAFRHSAWSSSLLNGETPKRMPVEKDTVVVRSDAQISVGRLVPRRARYQLARFCAWVKETPDEYQYRISVRSLVEAQKQGLTVSQLQILLNRYSKAVPPSLVKALERWEKNGSEARLEKLVVLRVTSVEVLQALRKSRASRFLGEPLGPTTIAIKPEASEKVLRALAELGYLGEIRGEEEGS